MNGTDEILRMMGWKGRYVVQIFEDVARERRMGFQSRWSISGNELEVNFYGSNPKDGTVLTFSNEFLTSCELSTLKNQVHGLLDYQRSGMKPVNGVDHELMMKHVMASTAQSKLYEPCDDSYPPDAPELRALETVIVATCTDGARIMFIMISHHDFKDQIATFHPCAVSHTLLNEYGPRMCSSLTRIRGDRQKTTSFETSKHIDKYTKCDYHLETDEMVLFNNANVESWRSQTATLTPPSNWPTFPPLPMPVAPGSRSTQQRVKPIGQTFVFSKELAFDSTGAYDMATRKLAKDMAAYTEKIIADDIKKRSTLGKIWGEAIGKSNTGRRNRKSR